MKRILGVVLGLILLLGADFALAGNMTFTASNPSVTTTVAIGRQNAGTLFQIRGVATFSASYATGGDTLPASKVGLGRILWVDVGSTTIAGTEVPLAVQPTFAASTAKIKLLTLTPGTGTCSVAGGTCTVTSDCAAGNECIFPVALTEATASTDESSKTVNVTVWGY